MFTASANLARAALDAAPDAMIIIDRSGVIRLANRQVSALFGYAKEELIGKPVEALIPQRFHDRHVEKREGYTRSPHTRPMGRGLDLFGLRQDATEFPVEISLSPIAVDDTGEVLVAAAIRDVSERKALEAELRTQVEDMRRLHDTARRGSRRRAVIRCANALAPGRGAAGVRAHGRSPFFRLQCRGRQQLRQGITREVADRH